jgi:N6-L-threonylcarbamoyladenine synthase
VSLVLGLESSCDETSVALLGEDGRIVSSVVSSQIDMHRRYGGVVPEIAARAHLTNLPPLLDEAFERAGARLEDVGLVVATAGPGLVGALIVGLAEARGIALGLGVPFVPGHHIEGHALSPFLDLDGEPARALPPRFAALVVSGGHSHVYAFAPEGISLLARTRDDAAGEAYDKVAKMAGLGYPGGPVVDRLARTGRVVEPFAVARFKGGSFDLSFSGLKTAVRDRLAALGFSPNTGVALRGPVLAEDDASGALRDLLAAFQEAVVGQIEDRLGRLLEAAPFPLLTVSGGVAANSLLRERLSAWGLRRGVEVLLAPRALTADNAAMVAFAGLLRHRAGVPHEGLSATARSRWPLESLPSALTGERRRVG